MCGKEGVQVFVEQKRRVKLQLLTTKFVHFWQNVGGWEMPNKNHSVKFVKLSELFATMYKYMGAYGKVPSRKKQEAVLKATAVRSRLRR